MKVRDPFGSNLVIRTLFAFSLTFALAIAGAAPLAAMAEVVAPSEVTSASVDTSISASVATMSVTATLSAAATPAVPVVKRVVVRKLTVREIIAKVGRERGLSAREITALLWMAKRESNYHPTSESRSECHGLFQLSKGMAHGHPWKDPAWNTRRAIKYMKGRYGGVMRAKAFWMSHHWY
ncbi:MAG TPA: hypothetical protein VIL15_05975 [Coriobacteriia bacterium]